jgi:hypothetical protein
MTAAGCGLWTVDSAAPLAPDQTNPAVLARPFGCGGAALSRFRPALMVANLMVEFE